MTPIQSLYPSWKKTLTSEGPEFTAQEWAVYSFLEREILAQRPTCADDVAILEEVMTQCEPEDALAIALEHLRTFLAGNQQAAVTALLAA